MALPIDLRRRRLARAVATDLDDAVRAAPIATLAELCGDLRSPAHDRARRPAGGAIQTLMLAGAAGPAA